LAREKRLSWRTPLCLSRRPIPSGPVLQWFRCCFAHSAHRFVHCGKIRDACSWQFCIAADSAVLPRFPKACCTARPIGLSAFCRKYPRKFSHWTCFPVFSRCGPPSPGLLLGHSGQTLCRIRGGWSAAHDARAGTGAFVQGVGVQGWRKFRPVIGDRAFRRVARRAASSSPQISAQR